MYKYSITIITLFFVFGSCRNEKNGVAKNYRGISDDSFNEKIQYAFKMRNIVNEIGDYGIVEGSAIGGLGVRSEQHERFLNLEKIASDEDLLDLVNNDNTAAVKAYAFLALTRRRSLLINKIPKKILSDTTCFNYTVGCLGRTERLNEYFSDVASCFLSDNVERDYNIRSDDFFNKFLFH